MTTTQKYLFIPIILAAAAAAVTGIMSDWPTAPTIITSVRGQEITLHGRGLYGHMSAEVAIQGIAQDWITLFAALPGMLLAGFWAWKGSRKALVVLTGIQGYLTVTYLFYLMMAMYNSFFLLYVALLGMSLFSLLSGLMFLHGTIDPEKDYKKSPFKGGGLFLIINAGMVALLWLGVVVPPIFDGSIIPKAVEHYTTLVVQGLDLGILLPFAMVSGFSMRRRSKLGLTVGPVYLVFLTFLMAALVSKIIFMGFYGAQIIPAVFLMPSIGTLALFFSAKIIYQMESPVKVD